MNFLEISKKVINKKLLILLSIFFLVETLSFLGYLVPTLNKTFFMIFFLGAIIISLKDLKYGVLLILAELLIGSKGYLFFFSQAGTSVSIRIAIWVVVMAVWLSLIIKTFIRKERTVLTDPYLFIRTELPYFAGLLLFVLWGIINGFMNNNDFSNIFFDANGWLYLLIIFPFYQVFVIDRQGNNSVFQLIFAGLLWLSLKTLILEYIFSHKIMSILEPIYRWVRESGVGEITIMDGGFVRVFFQSHVFMMLFFFFLIFFFNHFLQSEKISFLKIKDQGSYLARFYLLFLTLMISVILISFSRSFWVGGLTAFALYLILAIKNYGFKKIIKTIFLLIISTILSILIITFFIKFPYPKPGETRFTDALGDRATNFANESAVSSRYQLWPELLSEIKKAPITGQGFGTAVTYRSSDPRVLSQTADGMFTTYAFEWGWLDIWLKLGAIGAIYYLFLLGRLIFQAIKQNNWIGNGFAVSLLLLAVISFFTPYTNHPLGIGFIVLSSAWLDSVKKAPRIH